MAERVLADNPETGVTMELVGAEWQPVWSDAEDQGLVDTLLIGAGRNFTQLGRGAQRLVAEALNDEQALEVLRQKERSESAIYGELQRERPVASFVGEMLPGLAVGGGAGVMARGASLAKGLGFEAAVEGALGTAEYREDLSDQFLGGVLGSGLAVGGGLAGDAFMRGRKGAQRAGEAREEIAAALGAERSLDVADLTAELSAEIEGLPLSEIAQRSDAIGEQAARFLSRPQTDGTLEFQRLVNQADRLGVKLSPGQMADDPSMRQLEASLGSFPLTGAVEQARKTGNRRTVNNVFNRALGLDETGEITEAAMGDVFNRLGREFDEVAGDLHTLDLDEDFMQELSSIAASSARLPLAGDKTDVMVNSLMDIADDPLKTGQFAYDPQQFMDIRSEINREMRNASQRGEGGYSANLRRILGAMDDVVIRQAGPDVGKRYADARAAYRLADALDQSGVIKNGNVMSGRAATVLKKRYPAEFGRGDQYQSVMNQDLLDAFDTVRIGNRFGDIVGDSGTATRMSIQNLLNNPQGTLTGQLAASGISAVIGPAGRAIGAGGEAFAGGVVEGSDDILLQLLMGAGAAESGRGLTRE